MQKLTPRQIHEMYQIVFGLNVAAAVAKIVFMPSWSGNIVFDTLLVMVPAILMGVFATMKCRCPHCGRGLHLRIKFPEYCPGCGKKID